jgi:hypothetical protein
MHVSHETPQQTYARLRQVIAQATLKIFPGTYAFYEVPASDFPSHRITEALAFVRDEDVWSILAPANSSAEERFALFSFHFTPGLDNSGFVGWLASHLKSTIGTGVLVVCGQNSRQGGIFDYWGAPESVAEQVIAEVESLRAGGVAASSDCFHLQGK